MSSRWILFIIAPCVAAQLSGAQGIRRRSRERQPAQPRPCRVLCAPSVTLMPGVVPHAPLRRAARAQHSPRAPRSRLAGHIELASSSSRWQRAPRSRGSPSSAACSGCPTPAEQRNPFTLYTASELGEPVRANAPTIVDGRIRSPAAGHGDAGWLDAGLQRRRPVQPGGDAGRTRAPIPTSSTSIS